MRLRKIRVTNPTHSFSGLLKGKKMKNRIGVIIAVVSPLIISYGLVSGGCSPAPGYIAVDSRSGLMQPTFCLYRDSSLQERLGIRTIVVWKVQRSAKFDSHWDRIEQVWSLSCIKPTSPVSCLTYGEVPPGYQAERKAVPLEPEQFYSVWLPGFRGNRAQKIGILSSVWIITVSLNGWNLAKQVFHSFAG